MEKQENFSVLNVISGKLILDRGTFYYLVTQRTNNIITGKKIIIGKETVL